MGRRLLLKSFIYGALVVGFGRGFWSISTGSGFGGSGGYWLKDDLVLQGDFLYFRQSLAGELFFLK